jgi:flagellar protein FliO/FliZ
MSGSDLRRWRRGAARWFRLFAPLVGFLSTTAAIAAPANENQIIIPNSALAVNAPAPAAGSGAGILTVVGVLVLAGGGGWLLWRARAGGLNQFSRMPRQLAVEETRSLGNRQYLVVASYQDKKFLIGVCPGRIDLLSALQASSAIESEKFRS